MASNQEKFMQEIVEGVKGATASSLKMHSGLEQLAINNCDNLKENEAIEVNKILKDNSLFENLNKAKKDLETLLGGK